MTRIGNRIRLAALASRYLRAAYRSVLAARYAGRLTANPTSGATRSVLVVRGDAIGDFVLFLPALRIIRRHYVGARLFLIVASECVQLAKAFAPVDEVIPFDRKRYRLDLGYRIRFIRSLRARRFDLALNPSYSREPLTDELLYCSGARERIVFDGDLNNIAEQTRARNNLYCTRILSANRGVLPEPERNREFVERLTRANLSTGDLQPNLTLSEVQLTDACALVRTQGLDPQNDLIVAMIPGASNAIKVWPAERFASLADRLALHFGARILLCGSASDLSWGLRVSQLAKEVPASLIGHTTLPQLAAVLQLSALCVGNDSGPLHLAVAVGTPTLGVMGGGHFGRFYPYGDPRKHQAVFQKMDCYHCNWECIYEVPHCIRDITVEAAWKTVQQMFEEVILPTRESNKPRDAVRERSP